MRGRVSNNVGEAGDEEVSRIAITQRIVVTGSADTPIYVPLPSLGNGAPRLFQPQNMPSLNRASNRTVEKRLAPSKALDIRSYRVRDLSI
jgi:hypothetical protein